MDTASLALAGETLSRAERVALARSALNQLKVAGWTHAEDIPPDELADDPAATVGLALIAANTVRHFAFAPLLPVAGAAVGAVGNYLGRKKSEAEARKAEAEARRAEAERSRYGTPKGGSSNWLPLLLLAGGAVALFLFLKR